MVNEGTEQYNSLGFDRLVDDLHLDRFIELYGPARSADVNRGNSQVNFGISGAKNVGPPKTKEDVLHHYGTCHPRLLKRSDDESVRQLFDGLWRIGKEMKIDYCQDDFLERNPEFMADFEFIEDMTGGAGFAAIALCFLPLLDGFRVAPHTDDDNCPYLSTVLNLGTVRTYGEETSGRYKCRVNVVCYMRKAISDTKVRRAACKEAGVRCGSFVTSLAAKGEGYRLPAPCWDVADEVRNYYRDGVGAEGMVLTINKATGMVVQLALRSKASCEKQGNFLAPIASALLRLTKMHKLALETDFIEVMGVLGHLNNIYIFVTVLNMLEEEWATGVRKGRGMEGGMVEYIFCRMIELAGSVTGGPCRRSMVFLNNGLTHKNIRDNCMGLRARLRAWISSVDSTREELTGKQMKETAHRDMQGLSGGMYYGVLSSCHMLHSLCLLGVAPQYMLDYAIVSLTATHNRPCRMKKESPALYNYLHGKDGSDGGSAVKQKMSTVLASVTRYIRVLVDRPELTEATGENIKCEAIRKTVAYDLCFAGQGFYRRTVDAEGVVRWVVVYPILEGAGLHEDETDAVLSFAVEPIQDIRSNLVLGAPEERGRMWDTQSCETVPVKGHQSAFYESHTFTKSEMQQQDPHLLDCIKAAMVRVPGQRNSHKDYMARLNAIPALRELVDHCTKTKMRSEQSRRRREEKPTVVTPTPKRPRKSGHPSLPTRREAAVRSLSSSETGAALSIGSVAVPAEVDYQAMEVDVAIHSASADRITKRLGALSFHEDQPGVMVSTGERSQPGTIVTSRESDGCWTNWTTSTGACPSHAYEIKYRRFETRRQAEGSLLGSWGGISSHLQLESLGTVSSRFVLRALAHKALVLQQPTAERTKVPQVTFISVGSKQRRRGAKKGSGLTQNATFEETLYQGKPWYRMTTTLVPKEMMQQTNCMVQRAIACALGGVICAPENEQTVQGDWHFESKENAGAFVYLCIICLAGEKRLYADIARGCASESASGGVSVVGFSLSNSSRLPCGYFLRKTEGSQNQLAIALASWKYQVYARKRCEKERSTMLKSGTSKKKHGAPIFIRLL